MAQRPQLLEGGACYCLLRVPELRHLNYCRLGLRKAGLKRTLYTQASQRRLVMLAPPEVSRSEF